MRFNPLRRLRAAQAAQPQARQPKGVTGTIIRDGFLSTTEYRSDLVGKSGLQVWDKMLRSDGSVVEAYEHMVSPVKNASWGIEPASDDPDHLEQAALVKCAYFDDLDPPWIESLDEQLDFLGMGFALFETIEKLVEKELSYDAPDSTDPVVLPSRQYLTLDSFAPRLQHTVYKWNTDGGRLVSVVQLDPFTGDQIELPIETLLYLSHKRRGSEWSGRSILRPAYKHWFLKDLIERIEAVALERWGVGIPVAWPSQARAGDDAHLDRWEEILAALRAGEYNYIVAPESRQSGQNDGGYLELLSPSGSPPNFTDAKQYHRAEIKAAMLARFAELGHASVGARATGDIQSVVWYAALHATANYICQSHQPVIKRLIDVNYAGVTDYPKLVANDIEIRNLAEYADAISKLVSSTAITNDRSTEAAIRAAVDLPDQDETAAQPDAEPDPNDPNEPNEPPEQELQPGDPGYQQPPGQGSK